MPPKRQYKKKRATTKKRTTYKKKNAYKPRVKRATIRTIMPMAEGRKYSVQTTTPFALAQEWLVNIPNSWQKMAREQSLEDQPRANTSNGFTGKTLFSRYLNQHIQINFDNISEIQTPVRMRVLYGWAKTPYTTQFQSVGANAENPQGVLPGYNPESFIQEQLEDIWSGFLATNDPKRFKLKYNKELYISGKQGSAVLFEEDPSGSGTVAVESTCINRRQLNFYPKWSPNKKYHMVPCTEAVSTPGENATPDGFFDDPQSFWSPSNTKNKDLWFPFFAVRFMNVTDYGRNPKTGEVDISVYPHLVQKNTHYFLDI